MLKRLFNEPVLVGTAIRSIFLLVMTFGVNITPTQFAAVMATVEIILTLITRTLVTPNQLAEERVAAGGSPTKPRE